MNNCYNIRKGSTGSIDGKYRIVMTLFYSEGYPIDEIARILQIPKSTVQTRLYRGREKLETYYSEKKGKGRKRREKWTQFYKKAASIFYILLQ